MKKRPDMTQEAYLNYWRNIHGPLFKQAPGLEGYIQNAVDIRFRPNPPFDGVAIVWYANRNHMDVANRSHEVQTAHGDHGNFISWWDFHITQEYTIVPPPPVEFEFGDIKLFTPVNKKKEVDWKTFERFWLQEHASKCTQVEGIKGYVINMVEQVLCPETTYDVFVESWFDSFEAMKEFQDKPEIQEVMAETKAFCQPFTEWMVIEYPFVTPPTRRKGS